MNVKIMARLIVWCALGSAVVGAVASLLGAGPERIRLLILFPVAFGLLVGGALAFTAREFGVRSRWWVSALSSLIVTGGLLIIAREAHQELVSMARLRVQKDSTLLLGLRVLEDQAVNDPTFTRQYREQRMALDPRFEDYLMGRVSALRFWRSPWPAVFWGAELLLGAGAAAWVGWWMMGRRPATQAGTDSGRERIGGEDRS